MAQQAGHPAFRWACNVPGCNKDFSRLADARRHATESHGSDLLLCHVLGCRWAGAKRKYRVKNHMKKKHSDLMSVDLEIPEDGSWQASPSVAYVHSQNQGNGYTGQEICQPTFANASGPPTPGLQPPYNPIPSSTTFSRQLDTNQYAGWQEVSSSSSQLMTDGRMGQYDSNPTQDQCSSLGPAEGHEYADPENENLEGEAGYV